MFEFFQDFDALRKGFCTIGQTKTVFTILGLDKESDRDSFDQLISRYTRDDGMFCYADFCADVDRAFTTPGLEREPTATITMPDATSTAPARRNRMTMTPARKYKVNDLEEKIRARVRVRRTLMKPTFQDTCSFCFHWQRTFFVFEMAVLRHVGVMYTGSCKAHCWSLYVCHPTLPGHGPLQSGPRHKKSIRKMHAHAWFRTGRDCHSLAGQCLL